MADLSGRIIVKFQLTPKLTAEALAGLCETVARRINGRLVRGPSATGRAVFQIHPADDIDRLLREIGDMPAVQYAEVDSSDRSAG